MDWKVHVCTHTHMYVHTHVCVFVCACMHHCISLDYLGLDYLTFHSSHSIPYLHSVEFHDITCSYNMIILPALIYTYFHECHELFQCIIHHFSTRASHAFGTPFLAPSQDLKGRSALHFAATGTVCQLLFAAGFTAVNALDKSCWSERWGEGHWISNIINTVIVLNINGPNGHLTML